MKTDDLFSRFLEIIDALEREKVNYILVGGFAVVLYGLPRATQDLDIFIDLKKDNIEKLQKALFNVLKDKNVYEISFDELKEYAVIRFGSDEGFSIDILSMIGETFSYKDLEFKIINIEGHQIKIATVETLYKLKENTFRAIDKADLIFLKQLLDNRKQ
jgi:predicted nucleotidyltransferase